MGYSIKSTTNEPCKKCLSKIGYRDYVYLYLGESNRKIFHSDCGDILLEQIRKGVLMHIICGAMPLTFQGYENVMYKRRGRKKGGGSVSSSGSKKDIIRMTKLEKLISDGITVEEC